MMHLEIETLKILEKAVEKLDSGFQTLPPVTPTPVETEQIENIILRIAELMQDNYPYFHPYYAGQMLKPPHPVARAAYILSMYINPNNHALDGGRASSRLEKEAVAEIAAIFGWHRFLGHLTGGGTMANMEALWISGKLNPGKTIVASELAHYTHKRLSEVLGLKFETISCDDRARMDMGALVKVLEKGNVGTVVATIGTTGPGSVDPLETILQLKDTYGFRVHADAAYGGYFTLADNLATSTRQAYDRLPAVDSIVIDPHKHGLQPYGCGCILFRDPEVGRFYKHDSPYTYFTSNELHLGEISLECSRAGASAVALWATQKLLPLIPKGEFATGLSKSRHAALTLFNKVATDDRYKILFEPELDIVVWAPNGPTASFISNRSEEMFRTAAENNLHLATFRYPSARLASKWPDVIFDREDVVCLRACLMKPEHDGWMSEILSLLDQTADKIMSSQGA